MNTEKKKDPFVVVLTGPESTGKTTLAEQLASRLGGRWIPEYAREYVASLGRPYDYEDVLNILEHQKRITEDLSGEDVPYLFLDTDLVVLKVWFDEVFGKIPQEMDDLIRNRKIDLYLLCRPDLPWEYDPVRENPGRRREALFRRYERELREAGLPYEIVGGRGEARLTAALRMIGKHDKRG